LRIADRRLRIALLIVECGLHCRLTIGDWDWRLGLAIDDYWRLAILAIVVKDPRCVRPNQQSAVHNPNRHSAIDNPNRQSPIVNAVRTPQSTIRNRHAIVYRIARCST
jgi:hypothetical protein